MTEGAAAEGSEFKEFPKVQPEAYIAIRHTGRVGRFSHESSERGLAELLEAVGSLACSVLA
jgi:hypothetical protein